MEMQLWYICAILFLLVSCSEGYDNCWDGTNTVEYSGSTAVTQSGLTCQPWADNTPHTHTDHGATDFPHDGSEVAASNFCRDPGGRYNTIFCYTMDPLTEQEDCTIPRCTNLPCTNSDYTGPQAVEDSADNIGTDTATNYFQTTGWEFAISCCGIIKTWEFYIKNSGTLRLQVWRKVAGTTSYTLVGENVLLLPAGSEDQKHIKTIPQNERITMQANDIIGWYTEGVDMITYGDGFDQNPQLAIVSAPAVGTVIDLATATSGPAGLYAVSALFDRSLEPYFTNVLNAITITSTTAVNTVVFTLSPTDDDIYDVAGLVLSIPYNTYFNLSGNDVIVIQALVAGTQTLVIKVTDTCGNAGTHTLTVTITDEPADITSLPDTVSVSESVTIETLLHTLTILPAGTYTCTMDSYDPTRPAGNPFTVKAVPAPSSDLAIYMLAGANIRHNDASTYTATVTCTNADSSKTDTSTLTVNVDPNVQPVFTSFVNTATISALTTKKDDVIYTATVTDTDPVVITMTCDPVGCPFSVDNAGKISATQDLTYLTEAERTYTITLTADDTFNAVTSPSISLTITDTNVKPEWVNLRTTVTQPINENVASGTLVFTASATDGNNDALTYSATFVPTACSTMFSLASDGKVTSLRIFDYEVETTKSCTLTVLTFDGKENSDPGTLVINIIDVDEAPVMSAASFIINTIEVTAGTALPDKSISATDPETTTTALSLNCGSDSGYLSIHATTGIVTMATEFDLEAKAVDTYTIVCDVLGSDATSMTSTSTLSVIISDANDKSPVFSAATYSFIAASGTAGGVTAGTVTASDADRTSPNKDITYSIAPTTDFTISVNGAIVNKVDITAGASFSLTVTATDGGSPALTDTATVDITVVLTTTSTTTTTAATTAASAAAAAATSSDSSEFFSDNGHILLTALAGLMTLLMIALIGIAIWRFCGGQSFAPNSSTGQYKKANPNANTRFTNSSIANNGNGNNMPLENAQPKRKVPPYISKDAPPPKAPPTYNERFSHPSPTGMRTDSVASGLYKSPDISPLRNEPNLSTARINVRSIDSV